MAAVTVAAAADALPPQDVVIPDAKKRPRDDNAACADQPEAKKARVQPPFGFIVIAEEGDGTEFYLLENDGEKAEKIVQHIAALAATDRLQGRNHACSALYLYKDGATEEEITYYPKSLRNITKQGIWDKQCLTCSDSVVFPATSGIVFVYGYC